MSNASAPAALLQPSDPDRPVEATPDEEGWSRKKFVTVLVLVFGLHVALVFMLGAKKQAVPRPLGPVPHLQWVGGANELVALDDPTLFARPNPHDLASAFWRQMPPAPQPNFDWRESPHYLSPGAEDFGAAFDEFVKNSRPAEFALNFKPAPPADSPEAALDSPVPPTTTMQVSDELAGRQVRPPNELPSIVCNDVLKPSTVQALVSADGDVASAVVLNSSGDNQADQTALRVVRTLRFAPAPGMVFGEVTFFWHTVSTNSVPAAVP